MPWFLFALIFTFFLWISPCKYYLFHFERCAWCRVHHSMWQWQMDFLSPFIPDSMMCIDIRTFRSVFRVNNTMATSACLRQFVVFCWGCCCFVFFFVIASAVVNAKLCEYMTKSKLSLWAWEMDETKRNERVLCHDVFYIFESKSQNEISQWTRISCICFETAKMDTQWNQLKSTPIGIFFWIPWFDWPFALRSIGTGDFVHKNLKFTKFLFLCIFFLYDLSRHVCAKERIPFWFVIWIFASDLAEAATANFVEVVNWCETKRCRIGNIELLYAAFFSTQTHLMHTFDYLIYWLNIC